MTWYRIGLHDVGERFWVEVPQFSHTLLVFLQIFEFKSLTLGFKCIQCQSSEVEERGWRRGRGQQTCSQGGWGFLSLGVGRENYWGCFNLDETSQRLFTHPEFSLHTFTLLARSGISSFDSWWFAGVGHLLWSLSFQNVKLCFGGGRLLRDANISIHCNNSTTLKYIKSCGRVLHNFWQVFSSRFKATRS